MFQETAPQGGQLGSYTVTNNSTGWWVDGFQVTNPLAGDPYEPSTTQTDWTSSVCTNCFGLPSFTYSDSFASDYANYIGPDGGQSSNFFFGAPPDSTVMLDLVNANGQTYELSLGTPEPSTWALILAGFGGLGAAGFIRERKHRRTVRGADRAQQLSSFGGEIFFHDQRRTRHEADTVFQLGGLRGSLRVRRVGADQTSPALRDYRDNRKRSSAADVCDKKYQDALANNGLWTYTVFDRRMNQMISGSINCVP